MPVELFGLVADDPAAPAYGLISGHRRLQAFRHLRGMRGNGDFASIPALLRNPGDIATAPWPPWSRRTRSAATSPPGSAPPSPSPPATGGIFPTIEQAIDALYPTATRQKRARLRNIAFLVHEADGILADPETLTENQLQRLHAAWTTGFGEVIEAALAETTRRDAAHQWEILRPILAEAEAPPSVYAPGRAASRPPPPPLPPPPRPHAPPRAHPRRLHASTSPAATPPARSSTTSSRRSSG